MRMNLFLSLSLLCSFLILIPNSFSICSASSNMPGTLIHGIILDGDSWTPINDALIEIDGRIALSDSEGRYSIVDVPEGKFEASVQAEGYANWKSRIFVSGEIQKMDLSLKSVKTNEGYTSGKRRNSSSDESFGSLENKSIHSSSIFNNKLTLSGPSGGIEVPGPYVLDTDAITMAIHFLRARHKIPANGIVPERVDHFDILTSRIAWGFAPDWEIGGQFMHKSLIGYPRYDVGTLTAFHAKYQVSPLKELLPLSLGVQGGASGNTWYFAATSIPLDDLSLNLAILNNVQTSDVTVDWGMSIPLEMPEQLRFITSDHLELKIEGRQGRKYNSTTDTYGSKKTAVFNYAISFSRKDRTVDLLYRHDFLNDIRSYGIGGSLTLF